MKEEAEIFPNKILIFNFLIWKLGFIIFELFYRNNNLLNQVYLNLK